MYSTTKTKALYDAHIWRIIAILALSGPLKDSALWHRCLLYHEVIWTCSVWASVHMFSSTYQISRCLMVALPINAPPRSAFILRIDPGRLFPLRHEPRCILRLTCAILRPLSKHMAVSDWHLGVFMCAGWAQSRDLVVGVPHCESRRGYIVSLSESAFSCNFAFEESFGVLWLSLNASSWLSWLIDLGGIPLSNCSWIIAQVFFQMAWKHLFMSGRILLTFSQVLKRPRRLSFRLTGAVNTLLIGVKNLLPPPDRHSRCL